MPPDRGPPTGTPRWVKLFAIVAAALVVLAAAAMLTGLGGSHGPWRHLPSVDVGAGASRR